MDEQPTSVSPLLLRVPEACEVLAVGRSTIYVLMAQGDLDVVHIGRSVRITAESIVACVERRTRRPVPVEPIP